MGEGVRTVLITGTSSGLGLSTALALAARGWVVFASMRNPDRRAELDSAAAAAGVAPDRIRVIRLDVTEPESIQSALVEIEAQTGGHLDALVNNAGVNTEACFEDIDPAEIRVLFDTVVLGAMELTRGALPLLRRAQSPRLVFMSSFAAVFSGPMTSIYSAAKAAVEKFAEGIAWEVAGDGIAVVVVRPGFHRSNFFGGNSGRVRPETSRYHHLYNRLDPLAQRAIDGASNPANVANKIVGILDSQSPGFRYPVGIDARIVTATNPFIPQRLRHALARSIFRVPREEVM